MACIEYSPSALAFHITLHKQTYTTLRVRNVSSERVALKVKTTCVQRYTVRPSSAVIDPSGELDVRFGLKAFSSAPPDLDDCRDRFLLLTAPLASVPVGEGGGDDSTHGYQSVAALWAQIPADFILREKLPVGLHLVESQPLSPSDIQQPQFPSSVNFKPPPLPPPPSRPLPPLPQQPATNVHPSITLASVTAQADAQVQSVASSVRETIPKITTPTQFATPPAHPPPPPPPPSTAQIDAPHNHAAPKFPAVLLGTLRAASKAVNSTVTTASAAVSTERSVAPIDTNGTGEQQADIDSDAIFNSIDGSVDHEAAVQLEPLLGDVTAPQLDSLPAPPANVPDLPNALTVPEALAAVKTDHEPELEVASTPPVVPTTTSLPSVSVPTHSTPAPPSAPAPQPTTIALARDAVAPARSVTEPEPPASPSIVTDGAEVRKGAVKKANAAAVAQEAAKKKTEDKVDYHSVEYAREREVQMNVAHTATLPQLDQAVRHRVALERAGELAVVISDKQRVIEQLTKQLVEAQHRLSDARMATRPAYDVHFEISESGRVPLSQICVMALISTALIQLLI